MGHLWFYPQDKISKAILEVSILQNIPMVTFPIEMVWVQKGDKNLVPTNMTSWHDNDIFNVKC